MDGAKEGLLMMLVFCEMISRNLVIIGFFLRISQLVLYIFTHRRKNILTFHHFVRGLLTTSNLTFQHYKYGTAINQIVGILL